MEAKPKTSETMALYLYTRCLDKKLKVSSKHKRLTHFKCLEMKTSKNIKNKVRNGQCVYTY